MPAALCLFDSLARGPFGLFRKPTQPQDTGKDREAANTIIVTENIDLKLSERGCPSESDLAVVLCSPLVADQVVGSAAHPFRRHHGVRSVKVRRQDGASFGRLRG